VVTLEQLATEASKAEPGSKERKQATEAIFRDQRIERLRSRASINIAHSRPHVSRSDAYSQSAIGILNAIKSWPKASDGYHFQAWAIRAVNFELSRLARDTSGGFYMHEKRKVKDRDGVEVVRVFRSGGKMFVRPVSIDGPVNAESDTTWHDLIGDQGIISADDSAINRERIDAIESSLFRAARTIRVGGHKFGATLDHSSAWSLTRAIMRGESAAEIARGFDFTRQWGLNTLAKLLDRALADLRARGHDVVSKAPLYSEITDRDFDRLAS
jgi:hypothetical protein